MFSFEFIKPDVAIYQLANQHFSVQGRTVFIDDVQANIDASQAHGWQGVHLMQPHLLPNLSITKLA